MTDVLNTKRKSGLRHGRKKGNVKAQGEDGQGAIMREAWNRYFPHSLEKELRAC